MSGTLTFTKAGMLDMDDYLQIRLLHRDGLSARKIARRLRCGRDTIRKALLNASPPGYVKSAPRVRPKLTDAFQAAILAILKEDESAPRKQRHTSMRLFTHLTVALGQAACRSGQRVKFYTAQALVNQLEEAQRNYRLKRMLSMLEKIDLLIVDELGYISFSRSGAELLFQVFADRLRTREHPDHQQPSLRRVGPDLPR